MDECGRITGDLHELVWCEPDAFASISRHVVAASAIAWLRDRATSGNWVPGSFVAPFTMSFVTGSYALVVQVSQRQFSNAFEQVVQSWHGCPTCDTKLCIGHESEHELDANMTSRNKPERPDRRPALERRTLG